MFEVSLRFERFGFPCHGSGVMKHSKEHCTLESSVFDVDLNFKDALHSVGPLQ